MLKGSYTCQKYYGSRNECQDRKAVLQWLHLLVIELGMPFDGPVLVAEDKRLLGQLVEHD
jgi:hypothetical protein